MLRGQASTRCLCHRFRPQKNFIASLLGHPSAYSPELYSLLEDDVFLISTAMRKILAAEITEDEEYTKKRIIPGHTPVLFASRRLSPASTRTVVSVTSALLTD